MITTRQRNNDEVELHSTRTPMWTWSRHGKHSDPIRLSWNLAWHARSVHWCTCKLTASIRIMAKNIMILTNLITNARSCYECSESKSLASSPTYLLTNGLPRNQTVNSLGSENGPTMWSSNGLPRNQTVISLGSQTDQQLGHQLGYLVTKWWSF